MVGSRLEFHLNEYRRRKDEFGMNSEQFPKNGHRTKVGFVR